METLKSLFNALQGWITAHPYYTTIIVLVLSFMVVVGSLAGPRENPVNPNAPCWPITMPIELDTKGSTVFEYALVSGEQADVIYQTLMGLYGPPPYPRDTVHTILLYKIPGDDAYPGYFMADAQGCTWQRGMRPRPEHIPMLEALFEELKIPFRRVTPEGAGGQDA